MIRLYLSKNLFKNAAFDLRGETNNDEMRGFFAALIMAIRKVSVQKADIKQFLRVGGSGEGGDLAVAGEQEGGEAEAVGAEDAGVGAGGGG